MDQKTATYLASLNGRFYAEHAASFSETRQAPWEGWERVVNALPVSADSTARDGKRSTAGSPSTASSPERPLSVLDVACGNMRFARFLAARLPGTAIDYLGADSCDALVPRPELPGWARYEHVDIVGALLSGDPSTTAAAGLPARPGGYDLVCCFGFMHHVPGHRNRVTLLRRLVDLAAPGGTVAVGFWRFMEDDRLATRARDATRRALAGLPPLELENGDFFLGWKGEEGALRYCHSFGTRELDELAASVPGRARVVARYRADGRSHELDEYLLLRRDGA